MENVKNGGICLFDDESALQAFTWVATRRNTLTKQWLKIAVTSEL